MAEEIENGAEEAPGGSLADAIAAHLALKKEHGADADAVEHELEEALSPPRRDEEPEAVAPPPPEPEPKPEVEPDLEPEPAAEPVREPEPISEPEPVAVAPEPEPAPAPVVEDGSEADPEPISEESVASSVDEPKPGEITGTIEFEFGDSEAEAAKAEPAEEVPDHDLLEDTPDFFEETPEHDKLWFDEKPPRKFDF